MDRSILSLKINSLLTISMCIVILTTPLSAVEKKSIDMGYWLDQAAYSCKKNDQVKLKGTLSKIVKLVRQSSIVEKDKQYIFLLLNSFRQGQCHPLSIDKELKQAKRSNAKWVDLWQKVNNAQDQYTQLKTRLSYASNINSGSQHRFVNINNFLIANNEAEISLALDQANLPQSDNFNEFSIKHQRAINTDWSIYAAYFHQKYKNHKQYNLTVLELGLKETGTNTMNSTVYDINARTTFLNKLHWQNAFSISSLTPLKIAENSNLSWDNRINYNHYIQQKDYNALDFYSGVKFSYRLSDQGSFHIKTALQHDHALNNRPGKHRNTLSASVSTQHHLPQQWQLKTVAQVKQRTDSEVYNQALFTGKKRQQKLSHVGLSLRKPLGQKKFLNVDYTISQTQDKNIPLFDTEKNQYLGIGLEFNW